MCPDDAQDVFDEVTEETITPTWDLDVTRVLTSLRRSIDYIYEIEQLESQISKVCVLAQRCVATVRLY